MDFKRLQEQSQLNLTDVRKTFLYYDALLKSNEPHKVVEAFEKCPYQDINTTRLYVEALNKIGQGDKAFRLLLNSKNQNIEKVNKRVEGAKVENIERLDFAVPSVGSSPLTPLHVVSQKAPPTTKDRLLFLLKGFAILWLGTAAFTFYSEELGKVSGKSFNVYSEPEEDKKYKFSDVQGVDEAKHELQEVVEFLKDPQKFTKLGGKLPKGVLLTGEPGTGKTLLARAVAGEAQVPFLHCSGSEFDEMFVGVGAKRVRELFAQAKKKSPCIIFIDEIDAVGSMRNPKDQQFAKMTLNQLLVEMDGFGQAEGIIIIGATNFPESLDKALVRPGRFDRNIHVALPDVKGRADILKVHTRAVPCAPDVNLSIIARGTPGFSGADLANLINYAALKAAGENKSQVTMSEMEWARDRILMGAEKKNAVISEKNRRLVAYHEAGHALVALYTPGASVIHKATILPRGSTLGFVAQLPEEDGLNVYFLLIVVVKNSTTCQISCCNGRPILRTFNLWRYGSLIGCIFGYFTSNQSCNSNDYPTWYGIRENRKSRV
jgi:ATP-dependent metalloprotease